MKEFVFKFAPLDYVFVTLGGVNYRGRVLRVIHDRAGTIYDVQYVDDRAEFKRAEFYEDELMSRERTE